MTKLIRIKKCRDCPYHEEEDGIGGYARFCSKDRSKQKQIVNKDYRADFPSWCPLETVTDTKDQINCNNCNAQNKKEYAERCVACKEESDGKTRWVGWEPK